LGAIAVDIKVPSPGESITEVEIGEWLKQEGDHVEMDEVVVVIETDKANLEIVSPVAGVLSSIAKQVGDLANVGDVIATVTPGDAPAADNDSTVRQPAPAAPQTRIMPAAAKALHQHGLTADQVTATGPGGRILKEDVLRAAGVGQPETAPAPEAAPAPKAAPKPRPPRRAVTPTAPPVEASAPAAPPAATEPAPTPPPAAKAPPAVQIAVDPDARKAEPKRMSRLRRTIARRLVEAQQTAALLTTFNEVDMTNVKAIRKRYQKAFTERHGIKLGFMSFFVKAVVEGLKTIPALNSSIEDDTIIERNYYDIGVAIGGGRGLVVPAIRNAQLLSHAEIEAQIRDFAVRARDGRITPDELTGGTFSVSNGGIYGSMLSTPIVNPPQSGILGMHAIQDRPMAIDGQVAIRPMMYVALTYDHRIVDGREAVTFLKRVKDCVEDPTLPLLESHLLEL